jgi:hypothetical protein
VEWCRSAGAAETRSTVKAALLAARVQACYDELYAYRPRFHHVVERSGRHRLVQVLGRLPDPFAILRIANRWAMKRVYPPEGWRFEWVEDSDEERPMNPEEYPEKDLETSRIPRLAYAFTDNGIELPVLDITHPQFLSSIDENRLDEVSKASMQKMLALGGMSDAQKRTYYERLLKSYIFGHVFVSNPGANFMSGMSTYVYKLGPNLIGGGPDREFDRSASMDIGGVAMRMRIRDLCRLQANAVIPQLESSPQKSLCFMNIAGGAASDSINTLILILKENPTLLRSRKIEIHVLDIDTIGPHFALCCIEALKAQAHHFRGLDIAFHHIPHDWKDTDGLIPLLSNKNDCIVMCASEGGLFEYGVDQDIVRNLNVLYAHSPDGTRIAGTIVHEPNKVHATVSALAKASNAGLRFLGVSGLTGLLEQTGWRSESVQEQNPVYAVFTLKKDKLVTVLRSP